MFLLCTIAWCSWVCRFGMVLYKLAGPDMENIICFFYVLLHGLFCIVEVSWTDDGIRNNLFTVLTRVPPPRYTVLTRPE